MKLFQAIFGAALIIGGMALGLYVGFWLMFIGGIVDVINAVKAPETEVMAVALGIAKAVFASFLGIIAAVVPCFIGYVLLEESK